MAPVEGIPDVVPAAEAPAAEAAAAAAKAAEAAVSVEPEAAAKIVAQVKHYFSDANVRHDAYMRKGVESNDGWVTFETLSRFNRLRQLLGVPAGEEAAAAGKRRGKARPAPVAAKYVALLAEIVGGGLDAEAALEVKEDGSAVRRKAAFADSDEWFGRTVHAKGLAYGKEREGLIDDLTARFSEEGDVVLVRLRRNPRTKAFKGNVLVEFATAEQAAAAAAKSGELAFEGQTLEMALLSAYHDEKLAADEFIQPELRKPGASYPTYEEWCAAHGRDPPPPLASERERERKRKAQPEAPAEPEVVPGVLVAFSGVAGDVGVAQLREAFAALGDVRFVEHEAGAAEGIVRFKEPVAADVVEKGSVAVGDDVTLTLALVDEAAEKAFFERAHAAASARGTKRAGPGGGRGRGRGAKRARR
ncbi:hypothetical protein H4R18_003617 [Coemansia javaensis]|uniref:Uncharacterized protein n=1 Tax=Coemansia javaensis TaxID=2761396 RepID=A0A9W8LG25_9FUNG|nr:hypothetical protein H4R18_003617 [Coemansia javaensis]